MCALRVCHPPASRGESCTGSLLADLVKMLNAPLPSHTMQRTSRFVISFLVLLSSLAFAAAPEPSAELQKALAAAAKARGTPQGEDYQNAFNGATRDMMFSALKDCLPISAPGVRKPAGFQCVLIIGKTGKPKWIIRDSRDPMAQCFYAKLIKLTYPPPPADNWPVVFGINM
jgi:hypothetical protein